MPEEFEFRGVPIDYLTSLPVVALVKANQMMANEQVKLLMGICFTKTGDIYEPIMVTMSIRRTGIVSNRDDQTPSLHETVASFQVPLITLLPISSLALEEGDFKFDMDVHSHHEVVREDGNLLLGDLFASLSKSYELRGTIKSESRAKTKNTRTGTIPISINVSARKLPLPLGVNTIIQAYSKAVIPSSVSSQQKDD